MKAREEEASGNTHYSGPQNQKVSATHTSLWTEEQVYFSKNAI